MGLRPRGSQIYGDGSTVVKLWNRAHGAHRVQAYVGKLVTMCVKPFVERFVFKVEESECSMCGSQCVQRDFNEKHQKREMFKDYPYVSCCITIYFLLCFSVAFDSVCCVYSWT